jgi:hypothetical protein
MELEILTCHCVVNILCYYVDWHVTCTIITLVSHDPFFQNVVLLFDMPILYLFALKIKRYTPSQGKCSMFYIPPRQWICFWLSLQGLTLVPIFVYNGTLSCFPPINKFASIFQGRFHCNYHKFINTGFFFKSCMVAGLTTTWAISAYHH